MRYILYILLFISSASFGQRLPMPIGTGRCTAGSISGTLTCSVTATSQLSTSGSGGTWSSSTTTVATIGTAGLVTGVAAGTTTISYTVSTNCYATTVFTVTGASVTYATWSPTNKSSAVTLSGGNLVATGSGSYGMCIATVGKTVAGGGKWYFEITYTARGAVSESSGLSTQVPNSSDATTTVGRVAQSFGNRPDAGNWNYSYNTGGGWNTVGLGSFPIVTGTTVGYAVDMAAGTCNVTIAGSAAYTWTGISAGVTWYPAMVSNTGSNIFTANFGASAFVYTVPSGYNAGWY